MKQRSLGVAPSPWLSSAILLTVLTGCSGGGTKPVQTAQAGSSTLTLLAQGGHLVKGDNTVTVAFADATGKPQVVQSPRIRAFMPAMGQMPMMDEKADLAPTSQTGAYQATIDLPTSGTWQTTIAFSGSAGPQQATFNVQVP